MPNLDSFSFFPLKDTVYLSHLDLQSIQNLPFARCEAGAQHIVFHVDIQGTVLAALEVTLATHMFSGSNTNTTARSSAV